MSGSSTVAASVAFPVAAAAALAASFVLVTRLERLAGRWHLSEAMLGVVIALAADSPEISSAVAASIRGQTQIGAGVVLGSNVFNLAALLGLSVIVAGRIALHRRVVVLEGVAALWVALVTLVVVTTGVGAGVGLALVSAVVVPYLVISAMSINGRRKLRLPARVARWIERALSEEEQEIAEAIHPRTAGSFDLAVAAGCLIVVIGSSAVMERSAESLGKHFGLSSLIVGGVVLAAVTSLPNAVGAVFLAVRGRGAAVLSEGMNSNMLNVVVGLLIPALFVGLAGASGGGSLVAAFYAGLTLFALALAFAGRGLSRQGGFAIVVIYLGFVAIASTR